MGTSRRAAAALSVPLVAACLLAAPPAAVGAASGSAAFPQVATGARAPSAAPEPVGGPKLASRGIVAGTGAGVPGPPKIKASSYLIADGDTGDVLAAKDAHGHYLPASTLKTLTTLTLVSKLDPNLMVRPTQATCDVEGTKVGMTPKMEYKVSDLFYALMMMSANDAALALAQANGGLAKTLADMNAEARRINARDTLAGSPNGLDKDLGLSVKTQHTSAYDLALILREGLKNADFRRYVEKIDHYFPAPPSKKERKKGKKTSGYPIHTHNRLLPGQPHAYQGMLGGKNGYTNAAGQTYVAAARQGKKTIVISLMRADKPPSEYAADLLDWGFAAHGKVEPVGSLVPPGAEPEKKPVKGKPGNLLPHTLEGEGSGRNWGLIGGAVAGGVLAIAVIATVLRRRREEAAYGGESPPPREPAHDDAEA
ncbi:D-alanyl-D-alanine carboxypeptidase family protein [Spirillospora sp. CA-294931]|uniref:D-alanyl-D-alanine carboxypeptidase family protein n=1 Tax=Spirillospora sp. CA-294931 TaxID=3240042 RepID=UPI003D8A8180